MKHKVKITDPVGVGDMDDTPRPPQLYVKMGPQTTEEWVRWVNGLEAGQWFKVTYKAQLPTKSTIVFSWR